MNTVNYEIVDGIGVITVNNPPVNALSHSVRSGIQAAVDAAQQDASKALLIICEGRTFIAGADISEFGKPIREPNLPELINEIEASAKLVVAALHGTALGGGFELALGCHYRCALDSAKVGLPEVKLGLFPGAGGTQRIPRLAGVAAAIELMGSGAPIAATEAVSLGLLDKIVSGDLRSQALAYVQQLLDDDAPVRRSSSLEVEAVDGSVFDAAREKFSKRARGQLAPQKMIDAVAAATTKSFADGLATERELFLELMAGSQSAAMRHLFFAEREAARIKGIGRDTQKRTIEKVGIIGGGTMGGGIAMSFANAGIAVTLLEINDEALARGLAIIDKNYAGSVKRGKLSEEKANVCRAQIQGVTDYSALADVDMVIEAVFEDPELKKDIFKKLDAVCKPGAILATNTSYQDVNAIAAVTNRPEDCLGMHFFSPAHIMKLLEVVRGDKTADDVLATAMAVGKQIRKVCVMSGVCYGFIGNRMLQGYFREAQLCLIEGGLPESIDAALYDWGMAMGPISVADLAGLDVGYKARQALAEDDRGDPKASRVPDALVEAGRLGQKSGAGFYNYDPDTRQKTSDPEVQQIIEREAKAAGIEREPIAADEIVDRLIFALVNEGMNILQEGIAQRPGDIDVVYAYGYGFPAWRGGPMHYADEVGLERVLQRIIEFRDRFGADNWTPAPLLEKLVAESRTLAEWSNGKLTMTMQKLDTFEEIQWDVKPAKPLSPWTYTNPEFFDLDYDAFFLRRWQFVCHVTDLGQPGDFVTHDIGRDNIFVICDKDGQLRAFKNVCRHRASRILEGAGTCPGTIRCPYHGWTYQLDGSLMAIPQDEGFPDIDKSPLGLHEISLESFHGLVFVRVNGNGPGIAEHFGDMDRYLAMYDVVNYVQCAETTTQVWNCNWKVAWDNYLENYHIPIGHPGLHRLLRESGDGEGLTSGVDYGIFDLRSKPSNVEVERRYQEMSPHAQARVPEEIRNKWIQFGVAGSHGLDFYPEMLDVFQLIPLAHDKTLVRAAYYGHPDPTPEEQLLRRLNIEINDLVNDEDKILCERVQKGLHTTGYTPGPLSQKEVGIHYFHEMVRDRVPVAALEQSPTRGQVATRNDAFLVSSR